MSNYTRTQNALNYTFTNIEILQNALDIHSSKHKDYVLIGKELIHNLLKEELKSINSIDKLDEYKSLLWIVVDSFYLLEEIECGREMVDEVFTNKNIKIDVLYSIFGAIYTDCNDIAKVKKSLFSIFTIDLNLLNTLSKNNYFYYIHHYAIESSLGEYHERYIDGDNNTELVLEFDGTVKAFGKTVFEARYNACIRMLRYLKDMGYANYL